MRNAAAVVLCSLLFLVLPLGNATAAGLRNFTSDGCSLFPDGTLKDRSKWCDCCLEHDTAYWRGGTEEERKTADEALRDCVLGRTGDQALANTMYIGVRAGGHPVFPTWYRWAYGWRFGRGYAPLTGEERQQVRRKLDEYWRLHPGGYCREDAAGRASRPPRWATPVPAKHLKNLYQLDEKVFRSAQPDKEGFRELQQLGIRTVLSFRDHHSDNDEAQGTGIELFRVKMEAGEIETAQVIEALRIIKEANGPILIHCWHGSDRTGLISALYRIVFQGWSKDEAVDELKNGGYGYHSLYKNIPEFIRDIDVAAIKGPVMTP